MNRNRAANVPELHVERRTSCRSRRTPARRAGSPTDPTNGMPLMRRPRLELFDRRVRPAQHVVALDLHLERDVADRRDDRHDGLRRGVLEAGRHRHPAARSTAARRARIQRTRDVRAMTTADDQSIDSRARHRSISLDVSGSANAVDRRSRRRSRRTAGRRPRSSSAMRPGCAPVWKCHRWLAGLRVERDEVAVADRAEHDVARRSPARRWSASPERS